MQLKHKKGSGFDLDLVVMIALPEDLCLKILCLLDHPNLAAAQQVCRKWRVLASDNKLWCNLFKDRWGEGQAAFFAPPDDCKSWKNVYEVQDRCDRVGLGLKIIREGSDYYLVHQGEILRYLGSRNCGRKRLSSHSNTLNGSTLDDSTKPLLEPCISILDKILFIIGDLEVATSSAKRKRVSEPHTTD
ncbi:hypothetical protein Sjap_010262 [Stephania japonica]|uniref:F-box protein n=1 Tax=Stephania japonica TaxID=461633 RepID=A0AAP0P687_9MAGN